MVKEDLPRDLAYSGLSSPYLRAMEMMLAMTGESRYRHVSPVKVAVNQKLDKASLDKQVQASKENQINYLTEEVKKIKSGKSKLNKKRKKEVLRAFKEL